MVRTDWQQILEQPAVDVAPRLLGSILHRKIDGRLLSGRIVETEAYDQTDLASHSYRGKTERTAVMFGPAGHLYVYFTYGMHYCCNIVTGPENHGSAVLIRALEPVEGEEIMLKNRGRGGVDVSNGPAKLCQAFDIDKSLNGHDLRQGSIRLKITAPALQKNIVQSTRIGISQAKDVPWRFYLRDNPYVSRL